MDSHLKESLDYFLDATILFGLLEKGIEEKEISRIFASDREFVTSVRITPKGDFRLDLLYMDGACIGAILSVKIDNNVYHIQGMNVIESYRGRRFSGNGVDGFSSIKPSKFLLQCMMKDLCASSKLISLEVLNGNVPAWKLYEEVSVTTESGVYCFRLLDRFNIGLYAKIRGKAVREWCTIDGDGGLGVKWAHIPDYGASTMKWSVNRVYLAQTQGADTSQDIFVGSSKRLKTKLLVSILFYGRPFLYIARRLKRLIF